jgi:hypothetical protein
VLVFRTLPDAFIHTPAKVTLQGDVGFGVAESFKPIYMSKHPEKRFVLGDSIYPLDASTDKAISTGTPLIRTCSLHEPNISASLGFCGENAESATPSNNNDNTAFQAARHVTSRDVMLGMRENGVLSSGYRLTGTLGFVGSNTEAETLCAAETLMRSSFVYGEE